ncbi:MAG: hypothetical protein ACJ75H_07900 [Thermoanaerobaculia bacterium]
MPRLLQCWLKIFAVVLIVTFATVVAVRLAHAGETPAAQRSPLAQAAESAFFGVFNGGEPKDRSAALYPLMAAFATGPDDARVNLLLGLNHLWMAAEGDRTNPRIIEDLVLAERFLSRAQELNPADGRIPSWLVPVRSSLARIERRPGRQDELDKELLAAYEKDPDFHSFSVALFGFASPRDSREFQRGLEALRRTGGCGETNPSCQNRPHWPHNREAFITFHADYELKAGHADRAAGLLRIAQAEPDFPAWPFRGQVEERLKDLEAYGKLFADEDPKNDPPSLMSLEGGIACQSCHRGR